MSICRLIPIAAIAFPLIASAHHTLAEYDPADPVTLTGTVKTYSLGNPHSWLTISVPDTNGGSTDWLVECDSVTLLRRNGWTLTSFRPGDHISLTAAPHIDGIRRAEAIRVTTPSGAVLTNAMISP